MSKNSFQALIFFSLQIDFVAGSDPLCRVYFESPLIILGCNEPKMSDILFMINFEINF